MFAKNNGIRQILRQSSFRVQQIGIHSKFDVDGGLERIIFEWMGLEIIETHKHL